MYEITFVLNMVSLKTLYLLGMANVLGLHQPSFHVPYACSLMFDLGRCKTPFLLGAGSIIDAKLVLVSVDTLNARAPGSSSYFYRNIYNITVHAGSVYMDPTVVVPPDEFAQSKRASDIFVPYKPTLYESSGYLLNPVNVSREYGVVEWDTYGVAFNVGILETFEEFTWTPFVMPIIVRYPTAGHVEKLLKKENDFQQKQSMSTERCFTYSYNERHNQIRYHDVTYLEKKQCEDAYCLYKFSGCMLFPKRDYHLCYRSTRYIDVCPEARGAALYCDYFDRSVLGILTFAPLCGRDNIPSVYTTLPNVIRFYQSIPQSSRSSSKPQTWNYTLEDIAIEQRALIEGD